MVSVASTRWGALALGLMVVAPALAGDPGPPAAEMDAALRERLEACEALAGPLRGAPPEVERVEAAGSGAGTEAVHLVWPKERFLVFLHREGSELADGRTCEAFKVGRALDRVNGRVWPLPGKAQAKAFLLTQDECGKEWCPLGVVVRTLDAKPRILGALRTAEHCDDGAKLRVVKAFDDLASLEVTCRQAAGAGWHERRVLVHAVEGRLKTVLTMGAGSGEVPSRQEKRDGVCMSRPAGTIEVAKRGAAPVLSVLEPERGDPEDDETGKRTGTAFEWTWDAARGEFVKGEAGTPRVYDPVAGCKRR